jgi:hypothetical protein
MRFHEAVASMAEGKCCKSSATNNTYKYEDSGGMFAYITDRGWSEYCPANCEIRREWEVVPDPSVKPLDFFGAMEAMKAGKAVKSADGYIFWVTADGSYKMKYDGRGDIDNWWEFTEVETSSNWLIVPIPEAS